MLRAHAHRDQFRGKTEPELIKWLQTILTNVLRDQLRKANDVRLMQSLQAASDESSARLESFLQGNGPSPSQQAEKHELLLQIAAALEKLPEDQRDVVIQRDLLAAPVGQIAEQLGRTEKSVAGLLLRGRRKLRQLLHDCR
jgi:RNA polymerase sigma-70 factor (ECF subfamily)